jgi:uncharacterized membrane protein HdeD (DUF308 family)
MADLPSGTVTFLFTDIEGSTALWERDRAGGSAGPTVRDGLVIGTGAQVMERITRIMAWLTAPYQHRRWWVLATAGIVLVLFGLTLSALFALPGDVARFWMALGLLWAGLDQVVAGVRASRHATTPWRILRGTLSAAAAIPALLSPWVAAIPPGPAWRLLALGLIAYGLLGLGMLGVTRQAHGGPTIAGSVLRADLFALAFGLLFLALFPAEAFGDKGD